MSEQVVMDIAWLRTANLAEFKAALKNPESQGPVSKLLRTPEGAAIAAEMINDPNYVPVSKRVTPSVEEMAQIVADNVRADAAAALDAAGAASPEAAAAALVTAIEPAAAATTPVVVESVKVKIVRDYQIKDEKGNPIGRPTHFEAWTPEEMYAKYEAAHTNAVRYAERIKQSRIVDVEGAAKRNQAEQASQQAEAEAAAAVDMASKDPSKLKEAISKVSKADREAEIAKQTAYAHGRLVAEAWMADHKEDFLPCDANRIILRDWFKTNNLELSYDNLELAFAANASKLAKLEYSAPVEETTVTPAANPPVVAPAVAVAATPAIPVPAAVAAVPVSTATVAVPQPVSTATASTPATATNTPAARRPGVNASLQPGSLSAQRPSEVVTPVASLRAQMLQEIKKLPRGEFQRKLKDANYVQRLKAAGIEVVGSRT